jgi:N-acetyl-anhydromuramyl-L-alanine amidase AmpD
MRIDRFPTVNAARGRGGFEPSAVVLHTTAGFFDGTVSWFGSERSGVSAHYLVGLDGRVGVFVEEEDTAHHAGRVVRPTAGFLIPGVNPNQITVGIEFVDDRDPHGVERPDAQYRSGAELLWAICLRWGIPLDRAHVVGHREINAAKTCPGNLDIDRLVQMANEMTNEMTNEMPGEMADDS